MNAFDIKLGAAEAGCWSPPMPARFTGEGAGTDWLAGAAMLTVPMPNCPQRRWMLLPAGTTRQQLRQNGYGGWLLAMLKI
jgi:hypothetical protein